MLFALFHYSSHKSGEKGVWCKWSCFKFRVELSSEEKGVDTPWQFSNFAKTPVWRHAREDHTCFLKLLNIFRIDLIAMPVSLGNFISFVSFMSESSPLQYGGVGTETHSASEFIIFYLLFLVRHHIYYGISSFFIYFSSISPFEPYNVSRVLDNRHLHAITETQIWDFIFAYKFYDFYFPFNASSSETARNEHTAIFFQYSEFNSS